MSSKKRTCLFLLLVGGLMLAGCSQELDLTLYQAQKWSLEYTLTYTPVPIIKGGTITLPLGTPGDPPFVVDMSALEGDPGRTITLLLSQMVAHAQRQGAAAEWLEEKSSKSERVFVLRAKGDRWEQLAHLVPDTTITVADGIDEGVISFEAEVGNDLGLTYVFFDSTVTLHTGGIISNNSMEVRGKTAVWRNPFFMQAELKPASDSSLGRILTWIGGIMGGLAVAGPVIYIVGKRLWWW